MTTRKLYSIRDWNSFETAQSRKVDSLSWVAVPNKHDGLGYRRLILRQNGPAIYGAWVLILAVASKCKPRGVLADNTGPLNAADLALKTGAPAELFSEALKVLSSQEIGWLLVENWEQSTSSCPLPDSTEQDPTGQDQTDFCAETAKPSSPPEPALLSFPTDGNPKNDRPREWALTQGLAAEFAEAYPSLDILGECRKALQWVKASPGNRKTAGGMRKFLNGWLGRAQNSGRGRTPAGASKSTTTPNLAGREINTKAAR